MRIIIIFFALTILGFPQSTFGRDNYSIITLTGNWQYRYGNSYLADNGKPVFIQKNFEDTAWKNIESPKVIDRYSKTDIWYRRVLPDWGGDDPAIFVRLAKDIMEVYLDNKIIYSSGDFSYNHRIETSRLEWHLFNLSQNFAGKTIIIHVRASHSYPGIVGDVLLGSEKAIISDLINKNIIDALFGFLFIVSGLVFIFIIFLIKELNIYKGFIILQISMGVYILVDSPLLQFIFVAPQVLPYLNHISMFSAAIGFFFFAEAIVANRYKMIFNRIWKFFALYSAIMIIVDFTLHPFHRDFTVPFYFLNFCASITFMIFSIKSYRIITHNERRFLLALNAYVSFVCIDLVRYYIGIIFEKGITDAYFLDFGEFFMVIYLAWAIIRQYVEMNKKVIISQENERVRIAKDLHDEIGPCLTEIKIAGETVKRQSISGEPINEKLSELIFASDNIFSLFKEIVWALNPANNTLEELATYLGQCAFDFLSKADIRCRLQISPSFPPVNISYDLRRNIILATKEVLNNVVKHAGASIVMLALNFEKHNLNIKIKDDGKGFDTCKVQHYGNGLKNIRSRIENAHGAINISSILNSGTTVTISIPLE